MPGSCPLCGFQFLKATGKFCGKCGARRQPDAAPSALPPPPVASAAATQQQQQLTKPRVSPQRPSTSPGPGKNPQQQQYAPPPAALASDTLPPRESNNNDPLSATTNPASSSAAVAFGSTSAAAANIAARRGSNGTTTTSISSSTTFNNSATNLGGTVAAAAATSPESPQQQQQQRPSSATVRGASSFSTAASSIDMAAFEAVARHLATVGLSQLLPKFVEMNINDHALAFVEEEDLLTAGIGIGAQRRKLLALFVPDHRAASNNSDTDKNSPNINSNNTNNNSNNGGNSNRKTSVAVLDNTVVREEEAKQQRITTAARAAGLDDTSNNNSNVRSQNTGFNKSLPIQTLQAPEDGLLSPEMLETANADTLREHRRGQMLGRGSFGSVYMALVPKTGRFYAVKTIGVNLNDPSNPMAGIRARDVIKISREISMMRRIEHDNVCRFFGCCYRAEEREVCLFMELMTGGTLLAVAKQFRPLPSETLRSWTEQILNGLAFLHANNIAHRDLKCGNVLVDLSSVAKPMAQVKLADFGAAKRLADEFSQTSTVVGSPYWISPETLLQTQGYDPFRADIWSLGCTICECATGHPPWPEKQNAPQAILMIAQADFPTQMPTVEGGEVTPGAHAFLMRCFTKDPAKRPTAEELLQDPWIRGERE